jgi:hypothetical protein
MRRRALILANGAFADGGIPPLMSPVTDGGRLRDLLSRADVGGFDVDFYADATSIETRIAVQRFFAGAEHDDLSVMLISGHGLKDRNGKLYFATSDTQKDLLSATALPSNFVIEQMDESQSRQKVLFIDTCYSGAFAKGMTYKSGAQTITNDDFDMGDTAGRAIITASSAIEVANENDVDGATQSVFTRHLIEGIETGKADRDGQGSISLDELFFYVKENLKRDAPGQTPQPFFQGLTGAEKIVLNPVPPERDLPRKLLTMITSKDRLRRAAAVEDLRKLIETGAPEAGKAKVALGALGNDDSELVRELAAKVINALQAQPIAAATTPPSRPEPALPLGLLGSFSTPGTPESPAPADTMGLASGFAQRPPKKSPHEMTPAELLRAGMVAPKRNASPQPARPPAGGPNPGAIDSPENAGVPTTTPSYHAKPALTVGTVIGRVLMVIGGLVLLLLGIAQLAPTPEETGSLDAAAFDAASAAAEAATAAADAPVAYDEATAAAADAEPGYDAAAAAPEATDDAAAEAVDASTIKY